MSGAARRRISWVTWACVGIGIATLVFVAYSRTVDNPLVWDDAQILQQNVFIRDLANVPLLFTRRYFTQPLELSYRPVATFGTMLEYALWGGSTSGYHLVNLLLHAVNALLLLALISRLTGRFALAAGIAALWALHPIHTEAVDLITFWEDLLCMLFVSAALLLYMSYRSRGGIAWLAGAAAAFVLGVFSKETAVVFPALAFAYDRVFRPRDASAEPGTGAGRPTKPAHGQGVARGRNGVPLFAAIALVYMFVRFGPMRGAAEQLIYHAGSRWITAQLMVRAFAKYLALLAWPARQCVEYVFPDAPRMADRASLFALVVIAVFLALAIALARWKPRSLLGFAWFALFLLPVSNIVPIGVIMAERYLYVPAAGLAIALAFALDGLLTPQRERQAASLLSIGFVATGISFTALTWKRNAAWETPVGFWDDACHCAPTSASMFLNLGVELLERGRLDEAERALKRAEALAAVGTFHDERYGTLPRTKAHLGILQGERGDVDSAVVLLREAVRLNPRMAFSHENLGVSLSRQGKLEDAAGEFRAAIAAEPYDVDTRLRLATVLVKAGHEDLALAECDSVLALDHKNAQALAMRNRLAAGQ